MTISRELPYIQYELAFDLPMPTSEAREARVAVAVMGLMLPMPWKARAMPPHPPPPQSKLPPPEQLLYFGVLFGVLGALKLMQKAAPDGAARWLPSQQRKRAYEIWVLSYSVVWMGCFAIIIVRQLYESFDAASYAIVCGTLASPLLLQPLLYPLESSASPLSEHHATRAQLWVFIFGFIGNYWYTHYFYCVLQARYTMPAWRLNDVPIAMYLATHFYFSSYHVFSNLVLRRVLTGYAPGWRRSMLFVWVIVVLSYSMAFMETLTISHFPYYDFEDREKAYTLGSAFYGIYFIVSFPVYFALDEVEASAPSKSGADLVRPTRQADSLLSVAFSSLGSGMLVLLLLDLTRLSCAGVPLHIGGKLFEVTACGS